MVLPIHLTASGRRGPLPLQTLVLAAPRQDLGTGLDLWGEVEDHRVLTTDRHGITGQGPLDEQFLLHAEPVETVGEVTHGLGIVEIGLGNPVSRFGTGDPPQETAVAVTLTFHLELLGWRGGHPGTDDDAFGFRIGLGGTRLLHQLGHGVDEWFEPRTRLGGNGEDREATSLDVGLDHLGEVIAVGYVHLVESHQTRAILQTTVRRQLTLDDVEVADRITSGFIGGAVDDVDDGSTPFDVTQEVKSQSLALGGTGDESGHVGHGVRRLTGHDDAEVRHQGGERVVGDLGACPRDRRDEARLASRGEPDQADVGDDLEFEPDPALLALLAQQGETGSLAGRRRQGSVAQPAASPSSNGELCPSSREIGERLAGLDIGDDRAVGHHEYDVGTIGTILVVTTTGLTIGGLASGQPVIVDEGGELRIDAHDHRPTVAAVATIGPTQRFELLPLDRGAAVAAVAGDGKDRGAVDEGRNGHGTSPGKSRGEFSLPVRG